MLYTVHRSDIIEEIQTEMVCFVMVCAEFPIINRDDQLPYPRFCAHRGCSKAAPENSMAAFAAALELGAAEIEFDLWPTADGEIVSTHDAVLDRCSDGTGKVSDHAYAELLQYDFGVHWGETFRGTRIPRFEEILQTFGKRIILNVEIKSPDIVTPLPEAYLRKIVDLICRYDCRDHAYLMTGNDAVMEQLIRLAPDLPRCCGGGGTVERRWQIVDRAIRFGCKKLQFHRDCFNHAMIEQAHAHGIFCNVWWSDDPDECARFFALGIDTVLTNDFAAVRHIL